MHRHLALRGGPELADLPVHTVWVGDWQRDIPAYIALKSQRCGLFHQIVDQRLPDWRQRLVLELQGTPLSQRHWLRVHQGRYGPAWPADRGPFPGGFTPIEGLVLCGAGVFPGIGVPPVAISGAQVAHRFVPEVAQRRLLQELELVAGC